jgi:hypothetical protein
MKAKTVKEVLIAVEWILTHKGWAQGSYYQTQNGKHRYTLTPDVQAFCLLGAIEAVETDYGTARATTNFLRLIIEQRSISRFNDEGY